MFSPEASISSARSSLRNPRRRPRNSDGPQQQQPRRKRSKVGEEAFKPTGDEKSNGNGTLTANGHAGPGSVESSLVLGDMPVREKVKTVTRLPKEDMPHLLNMSSNYYVKKLPGFPPALLGGSIPYRAYALPTVGLALALTSDQALIWDYTSGSAPSKTLALPLPVALKNSNPLPLGAIVRNGPTNDYGVVAVAPSTGRIVFWENIDSADTRRHSPLRKQALEGSIKLYAGEYISNLVDADHAGYVLVLSSGRLAQLTLRDAQGRPSINITMFNILNGSGGRFFSFKGLLGGSARKMIASVQVRPSESKGQMEAITATRDGQFQVWDLSWSGQQVFKREVNVRESMLATVQHGSPHETRGQHDIYLLDFAIMEKQPNAATTLLVLVGLNGQSTVNYSLLEIDLADEAAMVRRMVPLRNYHPDEHSKEPFGSLLLPNPSHTAFVQLPGAVVVASLTLPDDSPDAQLLADTGNSAITFQDSVYFRPDAHVRIVGQAKEQPSKKPTGESSIIIFVQDYGIIRIAVFARPQRNPGDSRTRVTATSKFYQATFYSVIPGTILDHSVKNKYSFSDAEVELAVRTVSEGILCSLFDAVDPDPVSVDQQLILRGYFLDVLIKYIQTQDVHLSSPFRFYLMQNAEKLSSCHEIWKWYQGKLQEYEAHPEDYTETNVLGDMIRAVHEKFKTPSDPRKGETDPIRHYFLKDIAQIHVLIPWAWSFLRMFYIKPDSGKELKSIMQRLSEANDVFMIALENGYRFRQEKAEQYGLDPNNFDDGILKPGCGYDTIPEFWTSTHNINNSLRSLIDVGRKYANDCYESSQEEEVAQKVAKDNPRLVRLNCQTHIERFQWALEQPDEKNRQKGKALKEEWNVNARPVQIFQLASIGLATEGMELAEHYRDMPCLVDLIWEETTWLEDSKANSQSKMEQAEINIKLNRIKDRITQAFLEYGDDWAHAYFLKHIVTNRTAELFEKAPSYQKYFTKFIRGHSTRAKLCWINEVSGEKNYESAAVALRHAATKRETNVWSYSVELSIAKLSLMAHAEAEAESPVAEPPEEDKVAHARYERTQRARAVATTDILNRLEYSKIQEQLYERLLPTISGALDDESALELLMAEFGQGRLVERPALQSLLKQGFNELIHHRLLEPCLMIDVLTLMTYEEEGDPNIITSNEFAFALRALIISWEQLQRTVRQGLSGLIWKRLLLQDNWEEINSSREPSDEKHMHELAHTTVGWTFRQMLGMMVGKVQNPNVNFVLPPPIEQMYGAGCTDGELCLRFPEEDLRRPIIEENLLDESLVKERVSKYRVEDWFKAALLAGRYAFEHEDDEEGEGDDVEGVEEGTEQISQSVEGMIEEATVVDVEMEEA